MQANGDGLPPGNILLQAGKSFASEPAELARGQLVYWERLVKDPTKGPHPLAYGVAPWDGLPKETQAVLLNNLNAATS